ncbi:hypothetical protein JMJ35_003304 [Cladonia borealis]|uniref:Major facilitator superfamily (MFS) profile domain-containing protein n=1 Tax=Cladonia borealis TaxID=184061 RepID=A0AA39R4D5_9LECA|nr:hypothetical protein JMJ35_003304 [Cladonia borealis]
MVPFPRRQLFILALCRICEPIAFMSIFPYVYYMILSFDITTNPTQVATYAGMVTSAFAFAEFSSGVAWGRISDKVGRKPVLLGGLAGTALSTLVFGFAPRLEIAVLGRALGGLLNGNMGVLQTTIAEIVTVKEHQPRAYSIMPFVWCLGSIVGPALGGALAQPCDNYPTVFPRGTIFDHYPFLLPNLVCAAVLAVGVLIGILFLEETHGQKKHRRDLGIVAGQWILSHIGHRQVPAFAEKPTYVNFKDYNILVEDEPPPGYRTTEGSPRLASSRAQSPSAPRHFKHHCVWDFGIPLNILRPASTSFTGGFAFSTKKIGFMLSVQGVYSMLAQLFIFSVCRPPFWHIEDVPLRGDDMATALSFGAITYHVLAFPSNAMLLTNSAPSLLVLGVINGVAASTASLARACGPTVTGILHSWGLGLGSSGLAWWASGMISLLGALESLWLEEVKGRMDEPGVQDEEALPDEALIDPLALDAAINAAGDFPPQSGQGDPQAQELDTKVRMK